MELDTGSAVSIMSESDYNDFFNKEKLNSSSIVLKTYTGERVRPLGLLPVTVEYNDRKEILNVYIIPKGGTPLWGHEWLRVFQMGLNEIKNLSVLPAVPQTTKEKLELILRDAAPVFQSGIGTLKSIKGKIVLKDGATPWFQKSCPVPYVIRQIVESELDRLEENEVLSKVDWSPWVTPVVAVVKKWHS